MHRTQSSFDNSSFISMKCSILLKLFKVILPIRFCMSPGVNLEINCLLWGIWKKFTEPMQNTSTKQSSGKEAVYNSVVPNLCSLEARLAQVKLQHVCTCTSPPLIQIKLQACGSSTRTAQFRIDHCLVVGTPGITYLSACVDQ